MDDQKTISTSRQIIDLTNKYSARNYNPLPLVLSRGEGLWVWDADGNKYMDCLSAYSAVSQGHSHPKIIGVLVEQSKKLTLTSRAFHNDQMGPFLEKLCKVCDMEMALPMNTGAEAVETAIKAARKWGYKVKGVEKDKAEIIVCGQNFHGRTTTIVGFSSEDQYKDGFGPFTPGFVEVEFGNLEALKKAVTPNTVGFLLEPIQAEGGIIVPPEGYLTQAKKICQDQNVLFILDEIQTGWGRTGRLFAHHHEEGAKPDILILGKTLGGGVYPVSAVVARADVLGVFQPGDHGSTFGGNPLGAAVAKKSIEVIVEEKMSENAREMGQYLRQKLGEINSPHVAEIRGKGLLIGIEIKVSSGSARPFCEKLMDLGLLAKETHGQVIRLAPPLVVTKDDIDWIADKLAQVL